VEGTMGHEHFHFGFNPEEPDIIYTMRHDEWTPIPLD
jgi:hypothetical protein